MQSVAPCTGPSCPPPYHSLPSSGAGPPPRPCAPSPGVPWRRPLLSLSSPLPAAETCCKATVQLQAVLYWTCEQPATPCGKASWRPIQKTDPHPQSTDSASARQGALIPTRMSPSRGARLPFRKTTPAPRAQVCRPCPPLLLPPTGCHLQPMLDCQVLQACSPELHQFCLAQLPLPLAYWSGCPPPWQVSLVRKAPMPDACN
mmetsp:Transcript_43641/g.125987  ORF Transcript_43641/g.125987 Transcript_43641/m.125987 type:complete len:202 (-) Transcript_43641:2077-2682(-)